MGSEQVARPIGAVLLIAAIGVLIAAPVLALVTESITPLLHGQGLQAALGDRALHNLSTTLKLGSLTALFALILGTALAILLDARPPKLLRWIEPLLLGSFLIPPYLTAMAWALIVGPVGLWNQVFGYGGQWLALWLYTLQGIAMVMALHLTPLVYVMARAALRSVDHRQIEAAQVHGANPLYAHWMVYLRSVLPALLAATLLVFLAGCEEFGVPKVLGNLAGVQVLSVSVEQALDVWPVNLPRAASVGLLLGLIGLIAWLIALPLTRTISSASHRRTASARWWSSLPPLLFAAVATGLPLSAILVTASQKAVTNGMVISNWTWQHFRHVLSPGDGGILALKTSVMLALVTSILGMALAVLTVFTLQHLPQRMRRLTELIGYVPQAIPGVVMATGLILFWNAPGNPLPIYGHVYIIGISYLALTFPYGLRYASSGIQQIPSGFLYAASVHGSTPRRVLGRITLPLAWPYVLGGAALIFAFSMRELASSLLLQPPGTQVISTYVYAQFDQGNVNDGMALAAVGTALTLLILLVVQLAVSGRDEVQSAKPLNVANTM